MPQLQQIPIKPGNCWRMALRRSNRGVWRTRVPLVDGNVFWGSDGQAMQSYLQGDAFLPQPLICADDFAGWDSSVIWRNPLTIQPADGVRLIQRNWLSSNQIVLSDEVGASVITTAVILSQASRR